jgi:hypothetical protein
MAGTRGIATTTDELLRQHVALDVECLDRIYLNAYISSLLVPGQLVNFLGKHRGDAIPSPPMLQRLHKLCRLRAGADHRYFAQGSQRLPLTAVEVHIRRSLSAAASITARAACLNTLQSQPSL